MLPGIFEGEPWAVNNPTQLLLLLNLLVLFLVNGCWGESCEKGIDDKSGQRGKQLNGGEMRCEVVWALKYR